MQLAGAGGPETLGCVGVRPDVQVADLGAGGGRDADDGCRGGEDGDAGAWWAGGAGEEATGRGLDGVVEGGGGAWRGEVGWDWGPRLAAEG